MWNADIYDRYGKERIQPSIDLVDRLHDHEFKRILDVGCGTGMSTYALNMAWKNAEVIGVDLSEEMLKKAEKIMPEVTFTRRDCSRPISDLGKFDLIFSNAFLQWLHNQEEFIRNSMAQLNEEGIFAAQIPLFHLMPADHCILDAKDQMIDKFDNKDGCIFRISSPNEYYDVLSKYSNNVTMWVTDYMHVMGSCEDILEFLRGTAIHPYLEALRPEDQSAFLDKVLCNLRTAYPVQQNGKVLFPFKRLFMIADK